MEKFLYRGISKEKYESDGKKIVPFKPGRLKSFINLDDGHFLDEGFILDEAPNNTLLKHQKCSSTYPGPCISTTPHFNRAKSYALNSKPEGLIFKINRCELIKHHIEEFPLNEKFENLKHPEDDEVLLYIPNGGFLPEEVIVEIIFVEKYLKN